MTRLSPEARHLCEAIYCARGEMENRIKECQLDLFADRTSAATIRDRHMRHDLAAAAQDRSLGAGQRAPGGDGVRLPLAA